jgi:hypothetical protein
MNRVRGRTLHEPRGRNRHLQVVVTDEEKIKCVGDTAPTIDSIEVAEFESHAALKEWLNQKAPAFLM